MVPALVSDLHLAQFTSVQDLSKFLQATHPPQSPGILKSEEYHAIALFVFAMNGRSLLNISATDTPAPTVTAMPVPLQEHTRNLFPIYAIVIFIILVAAVFILVRRTSPQNK